MEYYSVIGKEGKAWKYFVHSFKIREIHKLLVKTYTKLILRRVKVTSMKNIKG